MEQWRHDEGERLLLMFSFPSIVKPPKKRYYIPKPKKEKIDPKVYAKQYWEKNKEKIMKKRKEKK